MAGLIGVYDARADEADLARRLGSMEARLEPPDSPQARAVVAAPGLACAVLHGRSAVASVAADVGRGLRLLLDGEIYNASELRARARRHDLNAAALCLTLFTQEGEDFIERLNGQFNLVIYDANARRVSIATDRFGYRPLFLARRGGRLLFATAMKAVVATFDSAPAVDGVGLLQTIRGGWCFGNHTWLEGIRVAEPGSWIHDDGERVQQRRYYRLRFDSSRTPGDRRAYADELASRLSTAIRRQTSDQERFAIPLSGGLDSRSLLFAALPERPPAITYTFGRPRSFDVLYARQLAAVAGVRHLHLEYPRGYLGRVLDDVVWRNEALTAFAEATFTSYAFRRRLAEEADALLYGHCGDCLTGAHLPYSIAVRRSRQQLIERTYRHYNRVPDGALQRVFNRDFYRRHSDGVREALQATFADIEGETPADVIDVWDVENRQRRGTFCSNAVDRGRFEVRAPFLDNDVVEHLRRAPVNWRVSQLAYKDMLTNSLGKAAAVPWAHTGRRLSSSLPRDFMQQAASYVVRRLRADDPRAFRSLADDTRGDPTLAEVLTAFTHDSRFPSEIFDGAGIREIVDLHWNRRPDLTHLVIGLVMFATAWRLFLFDAPARFSHAAGGQ